jgi:hypothetical protein
MTDEMERVIEMKRRLTDAFDSNGLSAASARELSERIADLIEAKLQLHSQQKEF